MPNEFINWFPAGIAADGTSFVKCINCQKIVEAGDECACPPEEDDFSCPVCGGEH